ncbi:MAG: hemolysin III family protein [Chloroflexi bacterium]|nr:hemolysin III family protein [Chloroflexota bacterium]
MTTTATRISTPTKPLLRGWSHAAAGLAAVVLTVALCLRSADDPPRLVSLAVYGLTLINLFAVSAIYHLGSWQARWRTFVRAMDHANIFVVIAGTYTPICVNVLSGRLRIGILLLIWTLAVVGVALSVATLSRPRWLTTGLYAAMGWGAAVPAISLQGVLPGEVTGLIALGGLIYSLGAVVYARRWPDPFPRVFGFHEIFHLFVIAASGVFFAIIWTWVVPFPRI